MEKNGDFFFKIVIDRSPINSRFGCIKIIKRLRSVRVAKIGQAEFAQFQDFDKSLFDLARMSLVTALSILVCFHLRPEFEFRPPKFLDLLISRNSLIASCERAGAIWAGATNDI